MSTNPRCSLLIPTRNGGDLFKDVVRGLQSQTCWADVEFIVVDSESEDGTLAVAQGAGARCLTIAPEAFNHGATRDLGISVAAYDRVVLMVQDAVPHDPLLIENLLAVLDDEGVAGVYAHQIPRPEADVLTKRTLNAHITGGIRRVTRVITDPAAYGAMSPAEKRDFCNFDNVCSAIRKDVWHLEPFGDADFGEDIAWAERVLKRGYKIVYEPTAAVVHSHDRPVAYEAARAYVCQRALYRQFGLEQVPTLWHAVLAWGAATVRDIGVVLRDESKPIVGLKMILRVSLVNFHLVRAKYLAERHEKTGICNPVPGV